MRTWRTARRPSRTARPTLERAVRPNHPRTDTDDARRGARRRREGAGRRVTGLYAAHSANLKAGVAWYGVITAAKTPERPKHPLDLVTEIKAPVLGLYGSADQGIPVADVEKMRDAPKTAGKKNNLVIYDGAPHGFHADYRPSYREDAAKDGWSRCLAWFKDNGVA